MALAPHFPNYEGRFSGEKMFSPLFPFLCFGEVYYTTSSTLQALRLLSFLLSVKESNTTIFYFSFATTLLLPK